MITSSKSLKIWIFMICCMLSACRHADDDPRPNILVIIADDLGFADLGVHGCKDCITPNIDKLAKGGIQFTQAYVSAPQCGPSRAGLITGQYQQSFGHEANPEVPFIKTFGLDPSKKTIASYLQENGYYTMGFGKWDLGSIKSAQPWNRGFDYFYGHYTGARTFYCKPLEPMYQALRRNGHTQANDIGYLTDLTTSEAISKLSRKQGKPWFAYMSYLAPHWPMEAKKEDLEKFDHIEDSHRKIFLAMLYNMDYNIGKLLDFLEESDQDKNTVIIFLSDNGGDPGKNREDPSAEFELGKNRSFNTPLKGVKGQVFEGGIKTPFFVYWPQKFKAGKNKNLISSLDILPTSIALAKGEIPSTIHGKNMLPIMNGKKAQKNRTLYWRWFNQWAIRHNKWKLVIVDHDKRFLYNIEKDPYETTNLIHKHPKTYEHLRKSLVKWNKTLKPAKWRYPKQEIFLSRPLQ